MRIARLCTMDHPVPPTSFGGPQYVTALLTAYQACTLGYDISIYASADSTIIDYTRKVAQKLGLTITDVGDNKISIVNADGKTGVVELRTTGEKAVGADEKLRRPFIEVEAWSHIRLAAKFSEDDQKNPFDIVETHDKVIYKNLFAGRPEYEGRLLAYAHDTPVVINALYNLFPYPMICLCESQKQAYLDKNPKCDVVGVVKNSVLPFMNASDTHKNYLAFIGRITFQKGTDEAIKIARKSGKPLLIGGPPFNKDYFENVILPQVDKTDPGLLEKIKNGESIEDDLKGNPIIYVGPVTEEYKESFLAGAEATLFPARGREGGFPLVPLESMSTGTPVIGFGKVENLDSGALAEEIEDGVTGYVIHASTCTEAIDRAAEAVKQIGHSIDRNQVRETYNQKWTPARQVAELDSVYKLMMSRPKNFITAGSISKQITTSDIIR